MKRSEMLNELEMLIVDKFDLHSSIAWDIADAVLTRVEEEGMLPPKYLKELTRPVKKRDLSSFLGYEYIDEPYNDFRNEWESGHFKGEEDEGNS